MSSTHLCNSCGLCCNGVLFHGVRVLPSDLPQKLTSLGLRIHSRKKEPFFEQPCVAYKNNCCSVYEERPTRCRLFECEQLKRITSGLSTEAEALEVIMLAHQKVAVLKEMLRLTGSFNPKRPLSREVEKIMAEPLDESSTDKLFAKRTALKIAFQDLQDFLNKEFRLVLTE